MPEYAKRKSDKQEIKIGTCESMYYLRYEDRKKVTQISNSLNAATEKDLFWRLPYPDEDNILPGNYEKYNRGLRLYRTDPKSDFAIDFSDPETIEYPGNIQLRHQSGLLINVECYHGEKLPEKSKDFNPFWNGKSWSLELAFVKNTQNGILPIVQWAGIAAKCGDITGKISCLL